MHMNVPMTPPVVPSLRAQRMVTPSDKTSLAMADLSSGKRGTHYEIGMYLKEHGEVDGALVEFLKATQENPRLSRAFYEQAVIFRDRNYLKLAESSLQQALNSEPDYQKAQILLAMIRLQQGEFLQAASGLSKMLNITPPKFLPIPGTTGKPGENVSAANAQANKSGTPESLSAQAVNPGTQSALQVAANQFANQATNAVHVQSDVTKEIAPAPASSSNSFLNDLLKGIPGIDPAVPSEQSANKSQDAAATDLLASLVGSPPKAPIQQASDLPRVMTQAEPAQSEDKDTQSRKRSRGVRFSLFNPFSMTSSDDANAASAVKQLRSAKVRQSRQRRVKAKPALPPRASYHTAADDAQGSGQGSGRGTKRRWFGRFFGGSDNNAGATGQIALPADAKVTEVPIKKDNDPNYSAMLMSPPKAMPVPTTQARANNFVQESPGQIRQTNQLIIGSGPANTQASQVVSQVRAQSGIVTKQAAPDAITFAAPRLPQSSLNYAETGIQKSRAIAPVKSEIAGQVEDAWTLKLRDLALHGTDSLRGGEAFMFSEETGDATLFLTNGQVINRHVLPPRDPEEVTKARRPDMNDPKGLQYNLSLLGKLLPRSEKQAEKPNQDSGITLNDLSKKPDNVWGWFRQTLNF